MQATVEFEGHSVICNLINPYFEPPISVSGSQGTQSHQQTPYSLSNAKLFLQEIIPLPNMFVIKTNSTTYRATLNKQQGYEIFCSISA